MEKKMPSQLVQYDLSFFGVDADMRFVRSILPSHYTVTESKKKGSIHCVSETGIRKPPYWNGNIFVDDAEDEEHWGYIMGALKQWFGKRFQEVFHNTCFCHVDFTIYLIPHSASSTDQREGVNNL